MRDVIKRLKAEGWELTAGKKTSHRQFEHPQRPGKVTVPGQLNGDIPKGTYARIKQQAGW